MTTIKLTPYDLPDNFTDFALMPKFENDIDYLANISEPEDWDYKEAANIHPKPILRNYLKYTYRRVAEEKKIAITTDETSACWNSGLISSTQEPIYVLFEKNKLDNHPCYWHFWKFCRRGEWELNRFAALPEMAHYFDEPSDLVYDARKTLRANYDHIVADNIARFPVALQSMNQFGLVNITKGAIDSAIERVRRNYKTAVPQYYESTIQLLLPLSLTDPTKADLALVVDHFNDFYRASTCLTLDMAYNNARQLARPDRDWLAP